MRPLVKCTVSLSTQRKGANDLSFCADRGTKDQALFACCDFNLLSLRHEKWKPMTCQKEQKKNKKQLIASVQLTLRILAWFQMLAVQRFTKI